MVLILKILRRGYEKIFGFKKRTFFNPNPPDNVNQAASDLIYYALVSDRPCMISRMGSVELDCINYYKLRSENIFKNFIIGKIDSLNYPKNIVYRMENNAGFFPPINDNLDSFSKLYLSRIKDIDILGSWLNLENNFISEFAHVARVGLEDLNAYNHKNPWSKVLEGKKVLVIHPFSESIEKQYLKREDLFVNKSILPEFKLITYRPVQSIAGSYKSLPYKDWFEALEKMEKDINTIDFDIALLGCGAYGLPLASFIKNMGKKAVHIGGSLQILFGITGRRWETEYDMSKFINEHWVRPSKEEIPKNFKDVENGCYW